MSRSALSSGPSRSIRAAPPIIPMWPWPIRRSTAGKIAARRGEQAVALNPEMAEGHNNLGIALKRLGLDEAEGVPQGSGIRPGFTEARTNLGAVLRDLRRTDEAHGGLRGGFGRLAGHHAGLGWGWPTFDKDKGRIDPAVAEYRRLLEKTPNLAEVYNNLGLALVSRRAAGRGGERPPGSGEAENRLRGGRLQPDFLHELSARPDSPERSTGRASDGGSVTPIPLAAGVEAHVNDRNPDRRLRVGYLSQDLRQHSVAYFLEPIIAAHGREAVEVVLYIDVHRPDSVTDRFKALADEWYFTVGWSDDRWRIKSAGTGSTFWWT